MSEAEPSFHQSAPPRGPQPGKHSPNSLAQPSPRLFPLACPTWARGRGRKTTRRRAEPSPATEQARERCPRSGSSSTPRLLFLYFLLRWGCPKWLLGQVGS